jgi:hypothetical protein
MGDAERYRVKAPELKAAAKVQTDYYLRSECEYIASVYLALADQADAAGRIG